MALGVILLILVLTSKVANADNEGPSDVLQSTGSTGSQAYILLSQRVWPRCVRSCELEAQLVSKWMEILLAEGTIVTILTDMRGVRVVQYIDADRNGFITAEEHYTEFLCLGFELETINRFFSKYYTVDMDIPVSHYIGTLVMLVKESQI